MKKILKLKKELILLLIIIVLASFLRLYNLGNVPKGMADDEIRETYTVYSIAHTGRDIFGNFLPLVFKIDGYNTWGQTSIYLSSILIKFLDFNTFTARFPYALFGIVAIFFFFLTVRKIFNNNAIALASAFVLSVSVWHIQLGRIAIDANSALLMYIVGIYIFFQAKKRTSLIILSMFFFFLGFYSYGAMKVIFLPLLLVLSWYKYNDLTKKQILIILTSIFLVFGSYSLLSVTQQASQYGGNPFFFQNKEQTALSVELERRASSEPSIIKTLYLNKYTYWGKIFLNNYLRAFSPQYLFLGAEGDGRYTIFDRGELYIFELPILILGISFLFVKKRKEFYLVLMLLLISPLPSGIAGTPFGNGTWVSRSGFMVYWLCLFIGLGIYYLLIKFKKLKFRYLILAILLSLYAYWMIGYLMQYYYDWSNINSKYFASTTKDLVYTTNKYTKEGKKVIISGIRDVDVLNFAFYNKINPKIIQNKINQFPIQLNNVMFTRECFVNSQDDPYKLIPLNTVYISSSLCKYNVKPISKIATFNNQETMWNIYLKK